MQISLYLNGFSVLLLLTEGGALKFASFTNSDAGKSVAIMVDSCIIEAPKIMSEIVSGRAVIESRFTEKEANRIAKGITGR